MRWRRVKVKIKGKDYMVYFTTKEEVLKNQICPFCGLRRRELYKTSFQRLRYITRLGRGDREIWVGPRSQLGKKVLKKFHKENDEYFFRTICVYCARKEVKWLYKQLEKMEVI